MFHLIVFYMTLHIVNLQCHGPLHNQIWKRCNVHHELYHVMDANMEVVVTHTESFVSYPIFIRNFCEQSITQKTH